MALNTFNGSNLEQRALKGLTENTHTDMDEAGSHKHHRQRALKLERVADFGRSVRVSPESVGEIVDDHAIVDRCDGCCEKQAQSISR